MRKKQKELFKGILTTFFIIEYILYTWIRIRIRIQNSDPDPAKYILYTWIRIWIRIQNSNPDPANQRLRIRQGFGSKTLSGAIGT